MLRLGLLRQSVGHQARGLRRPMAARVTRANEQEEIGSPTTPICLSIVAIRLFASGFSSLLVITFSRARTTPSLHLMPIEVPPFSTAFTAYSTWKFRPSGEKTEF